MTTIINMLQEIAAVLAGGLLGAGFGILQENARRRNERLQAQGKLRTGWAVMPGSGRRVVYLLLALVLIQLVCPLLFTGGIQWWVSGGVVAGYGLVLFWQLRRRLSGNR